MKLKFAYDWSRQIPKGIVVEIDGIYCAPGVNGGYMVHVIDRWSRARWIAIGWFVPCPDYRYSKLVSHE